MKHLHTALFATLISVVACILSSFTGCSLDRWAAVEPGTYTVVRSAGEASETAADEVDTLEIDRDASRATFTLADGPTVVVSFTALDRDAWPSGCPTNLFSTHMEVLVVAGGPLTIGPLTFRDPLLVRNCPPEPVRVVLREASDDASSGPLGGGLTACAYTEKCIVFEPAEPAAAPTSSIPGAGKGYELYSWPEGGEWRFSLVAGTDRVKTYEEVTGAEGETEAVLMAGRIEDLFSALDHIPSGAEVVWRSAQALEQIGMEPHDLALPPQQIINDVIEHVEERAITVDVAR